MLDQYDIVGRLFAASIAGAVIGWERESHQKPAGLRTHMLVSVGACAFMQTGIQLHMELAAAGQEGSGDIFKVVGGIVGGVGFLGAGSILRAGGEVKGLTTAATIWLAAAIGTACGLAYYVLAVSCAFLALGILVLAGIFERLFSPRLPTAEGVAGSATEAERSGEDPLMGH